MNLKFTIGFCTFYFILVPLYFKIEFKYYRSKKRLPT